MEFVRVHHATLFVIFTVIGSTCGILAFLAMILDGRQK